MMHSIGIILCFKQKSGMWKVVVTFLPSDVQVVASVEPNCPLVGKHSEDSSTVGITHSVTDTTLARINQTCTEPT